MSENVKVKAPKGCTSMSWGGEEFTVNKKGIASVPAEAVEDLRAHGVKPLDDQAEESAEESAQDESEQKDA
jgi:hypothetical protein